MVLKKVKNLKTGVFLKIFFALLVLLGFFEAQLQGENGKKLKVVATTEHLALLAREIGGEKVEADALTMGLEDYIKSEPVRGFDRMLNDADLLLVNGAGLEDRWLEKSLKQGGNKNLRPGEKGYLDLSKVASLIHVDDSGKAEAASKENPAKEPDPYYWLNPFNCAKMTEKFAQKLGEMAPEWNAYFQENYTKLSAQLETSASMWQRELEPLKEKNIILYSKSWANFTNAFGLNVVAVIQPDVNKEPEPQDAMKIIRLRKKMKLHTIIASDFENYEHLRKIATGTGAVLTKLPHSMRNASEISNSVSFYGYLVQKVKESLQKKK